METVLHRYWFDTRDPVQAAEYKKMCEALTNQGLKAFISCGGEGHYFFVLGLDGLKIPLDTKHLFGNQWNTGPVPGHDSGVRVFDWAEDSPTGFHPSIKRGHWLEQTAEMQEARRNRVSCGYCGWQEDVKEGHAFCPKCLGSEYLKASGLQLTRMLPVSGLQEREPLTEAEREARLLLYKQAQLYASTERQKARLQHEVDAAEADFYRAVKAAEAKWVGWTWLFDNKVNVDNVIYYNHANTFCFGWKQPIGDELFEALLATLEGFPGAYEVIREGGRTHKGNTQGKEA